MTAPRRSPAVAVGPRAVVAVLVLVLVLMLMLVACASETAAPGVGEPDAASVAGPRAMTVEVLERIPQPEPTFTQGLEFRSDGTLFESTGGYGASTVREVDPRTGETLRVRPLDPFEFGEGLTFVGDRLYVLTWREGVAHVLDPDDLSGLGRHSYDGEGWGLCSDGERLVMSDGSAELTFRDPESFAVLGSVTVTLAGEPLEAINELECDGGLVYANVWKHDAIVVIDPGDGTVTAEIDASGLLEPAEAAGADVLNGIARWPGRDDELLLTGKDWPAMFRVRVVEP